ncbi:hypothetical protein P280DRAFT_481539 [Massarina eburnea CBS 473.64]|uniref:Uncharacterized protein n=1 Tax=Massarina eburnea CBS 473.64 TaxID=1395130 RepID=A0A6A6RYX8_9PLEO|nr:hypothetical protein P280DRAFT_481539 [Massarina eburnea CBS 473.64]
MPLRTVPYAVKLRTTDALPPANVGPNEEITLTPLENRGGWVNPEDLTSMPQCIAQQDQSTWLSTMSKCTSKQCTRHFWFICTRHEWLTQLSCLSTEFSSDVVKEYLPYCSRSVLAKAQLFKWIQTVTGRTWLVDVGDANGLQTLSPASLAEGYAAVDVTSKAPTCLTDSTSASMEPFQHVMGSCSFTSTTRHTGDASRPWEYNEGLRSMVALDFETVGYDLTRRWIAYGNYFDKRCFCKTLDTGLPSEPCSGPGLALTRERLWLNATCGSTSLPDKWTDGLKTTPLAYIPTENWRWPDCVTSMPQEVIGLVDQCATNACELDSSGYCNIIKSSVDRSCFCRNISYSSCKGSCQIFEKRVDYVNWLHDLCGNEPEWHGLPKHWRQLTVPTPLEMIPWRWSIKSFKHSNHADASKSNQKCASTEWKLGSLVLSSTSPLIVAFLDQKIRTKRDYQSRSWFLTGLAIAALHLFTNWINAALIQSTPGYQKIPIVQLVLLWCSIPRFTWLTTLLVGFHPFKTTSIHTAASYLLAEMILQALSAYPMMVTVSYGWEHSFYGQGMARLETSSSARMMYAGALMWLLTVVFTIALLVQAAHGMNVSDTQETPNVVGNLMEAFNGHWASLEEELASYWIQKSRDLEDRPLLSRNGKIYKGYGALPVENINTHMVSQGDLRLSLITIIGMIFLWVAQWLFWTGFIGLTLEEFCPPKLGALTAIWIASSLAVTLITTIR